MLRLLIMCAFSGAAAAADFIGVTAAVEGQVTRVSSTSGAPTGPIESGTQVFEGDVLSVSDGGRAQVMLKDQTTFTLGSGAEMKIDEFVFGTANDSLNANITKGAFRFVSGKIAKTGPDAMTVDLPSAVIGVRGTQVAGLLDENGEGDVVLIGPGPNSFGVTPGAITVANDFGTQDVLRGGFAVGISPNTAPTAPVPAPAELLERVEQAVQELAGEEIAEEVAAELADPQTVALLEALVEAGVEGPDEVTNNAAALAVILGAELGSALADQGVNFSADALALLANFEDLDQQPPGPSVADLINSPLTGSYRYTANNVTMTPSDNQGGIGPAIDPAASGSFDSTVIYDFATDQVDVAVNGSVGNMSVGGSDGRANFNFSFTGTSDFSQLSSSAGAPNTSSYVSNASYTGGLSDTNNVVLTPETGPGAVNTFDNNAVLSISDYTTTGTPAANGMIFGSLNGGLSSLETFGDINAINVTIQTVEDDGISNATTLSDLGGTGVSVKSPE